MIIKSVEFVGAIADRNGKAPTGPQVAFAGRSNVGKSSLINRLLGRTRTAVARVSSTPGKTREINFFEVAATSSSETKTFHFYAVDLPGYGYAKVPVAVRKQWQPLIEWYLGNTEQLRGVVQLIDVRREPVEADRLMLSYLEQTAVPTLFVLTKVDKLTRSERTAHVRKVLRGLNIDAEQAIEFSAKTGEGRQELLDSIEALVLGT